MSAFDQLASDFDRQRPLPDGVPNEIRAAILSHLPVGPRLVDLGCGAGRIGWPFVMAGDHYTAVDRSLGMLRQFASRALIPAPCLAQADATRLPFPDAIFDGVLLVQVLSGASRWHDVLMDARRVLKPGGALFVGQSMAPDDGVDAQMKQGLADILVRMNEYPDQRKSKEDAIGWLTGHANLTTKLVAKWPVSRTPRQFIERHGNGVRFSALAPSVRATALARLAEWARAAFGTLDAPAIEEQRFVLSIYRFDREATP